MAPTALRSAGERNVLLRLTREAHEPADGPSHPLASLYQNGAEAIVFTDRAGEIATANEAFLNLVDAANLDAIHGHALSHAVAGGRAAATARLAALASGRAAELSPARRMFMREHRSVLRAMQDAYYRSVERRQRFVSLCHDVDVQRLTFEAYMNKKLVRKRPLAHLEIGVKNVMHLTGLVSPSWT